MFIKFVSKSFLVVLMLTTLAGVATANSGNRFVFSTDLSWNVQKTQKTDDDIAPGESVFIYVSKRGGRAAPANSSVSRVKDRVCNSDYCKQQRSLRNSAPKINLGAVSQKSLALGDQLFKDAKYNEAIDAYQKSVKLKPNYAAYFGMGKANFELKQLDAAAGNYEQAIKLNSNSDDAFYNLGTIRFEQKKYAAALPALQQAAKLAPSEADEQYYYGLTLSELKRQPEAVSALQAAVKLNPKFIDAYDKLVDLYTALGRKDEALASARRMIEIDPQNSQGFTDLGVIHHNDKKYRDALTAFKEAVRLSPKNGQWLLNLAVTEYDLEMYADALVNYQKAIEAKPDFKKNESVMYRFGYGSLLTNKFAEAIDILTQCAALNPKNSYTFFGIASAQMQSQPANLAAAVENLNQAVALDSQNSNTFMLLALAHLQSSPPNVNEMLKAAKRASSLAPNSAGTHFVLGIALFQGRLYEAAETELKEAVRLDPNNGLSWTQLCTVTSLLKKYAEARVQCQKAIKLVPPEQVKFARLSLVQLYNSQKSYKEAVAESQLLIKEYPEFPDVYRSLGVAYAETKKYDQAIEALKQGMQLDPQESSYHILLGLVYWDAGKKEDARREYAILQNMDTNGAERLKLYMLTEKSKKK